MYNSTAAARAYRSASANRSTREQEADLFRLVTARLRAARQAAPIERIRALADNRRLWLAVADLLRDSANALPPATCAGIISIGQVVQREMDLAEPNFDFLISINRQIAEGLSGNP
jgi:flagellar biosynthesis regulator FlaF